MNSSEKIALIEEKALAMRRDCIEMGYAAGPHGAHFGPALSSVEIIACLYFGVMQHDVENPFLPERDRFVLSKGHACLSYYAALVEAGYLSRAQMYTFKGDHSILSGHPSCHVEYGLEVATGSLGNGFAIACGMAKAAQIKGEEHKVYAVLGDGECDEGLIWEAAMNASKNKLDNMIAIVDRNSFQLAGKTQVIMDLDLEAIWRAFGWDVHVVHDGNNVASVLLALTALRDSAVKKPHLLIAHTTKGKGVSFMENNLGWHAAPLNQAQYEQACSDLELV